jgi:hypothetical protein
LSTLLFSTLLNDGEAGQQSIDGLAIDGSGNIYVAGNVGPPSRTAPTAGVFQSSFGSGTSDGFVAKIILTAATKTTLTASPTSASIGSAVTFTAKVAETAGIAIPTGSVTFSNGATTLGSGTLNAGGTATLTTSSLAVGIHSVTAAYGGDSANSASTSSAVSVTINAAAPTVTLSVAPTSIVLGKTATLTWSSTNASSCTAGGAWSGTQATSGTATVTPSAAGSLSYTLACTGAGGSANGTAALTVTAAASSGSTSSSGGGGTLEWQVLLGLALITLIVRTLPPYIRCSAAT